MGKRFQHTSKKLRDGKPHQNYELKTEKSHFSPLFMVCIIIGKDWFEQTMVRISFKNCWSKVNLNLWLLMLGRLSLAFIMLGLSLRCKHQWNINDVSSGYLAIYPFFNMPYVIVFLFWRHSAFRRSLVQQGGQCLSTSGSSKY